MNDINASLMAAGGHGGAAVNYDFSGTRAEAAQVIADNLLQMRKLAQEQDLAFLAYLLEMSFREAFMTSVNLPVTAEAEIPAGVRAG